MRLSDLSAEFDRAVIHWRVQGKTFNRNGVHSAMALAYIDARHVMDRLDEVCGPENWQSEYVETPRGRMICKLSIKIGDQWVTKADGAGDTDVEGEKGAISDALKRAAVSWGIGRYLYRMDSVWVKCEVNDKGGWKAWAEDPWSIVDRKHATKQPPRNQAQDTPPKRDTPKPQDNMTDNRKDNALWSIRNAATLDDLKITWEKFDAETKNDADVKRATNKRKAELEAK